MQPLLSARELSIQVTSALENQERLLLALESSGAGMWAFDLQTQMASLDKRSLNLHGLPEDGPTEISNDEWLTTLCPQHRESAVATFQQAVGARSTFSAEYSTCGGETWVNGLGRPIFDDAGTPIRIVGLNIDITDRKRSEQTIEAMRGQLLHTARASAMGAMAETLAHELNQPLAAIENYAAGLTFMAEEIDPQLLLPVQGLQDNAMRAGKIIRRLRSTIRNGGRVRLEEVHVDTVIADAVRYARSECGNVSIDMQLAEGPALRADIIQVQQVIISLVRNASQAMEAAKSDVRRIKISTTYVRDLVEIRVTDTGPGFPEEMLASVFDTSFTTKSEGMGLGLPISRSIIEAHGGRIWLENYVTGACVCFTLLTAQTKRQ